VTCSVTAAKAKRSNREWVHVLGNPTLFAVVNFKYLSLGTSQSLAWRFICILTTNIENLQALHIIPGPVLLEDRPEENLAMEKAPQLIRQFKKVSFAIPISLHSTNEFPVRYRPRDQNGEARYTVDQHPRSAALT
jgi:hypothetical protein